MRPPVVIRTPVPAVEETARDTELSHEAYHHGLPRHTVTAESLAPEKKSAEACDPRIIMPAMRNPGEFAPVRRSHGPAGQCS